MTKRCKELGCRNAAKSGPLCYKHRSRRQTQENPMKRAYWSLKGNAKRRGKFFDLTFEQFEKFAIKHQMMNKKRGRCSDSWSIDRKDNEKGYTISNLKPLSLGDNSSKNNRRKIHYDYQTKAIQIIDMSYEQGADDPF